MPKKPQKKLKLFVITMAHTPRMTTQNVLAAEGNDRFDVNWVTHFKEDRQRLHNDFGIPKDKIWLHGLERKDAKKMGAAVCGWLRDWVCDNLIKPDEWYVMCDDDLHNIWTVREDYYDQERIKFEEEVKEKEARRAIRKEEVRSEGDWWRKKIFRCENNHLLYDLTMELKDKCIENGTIMGGFCHAENYYFRRNKWTGRQIVPGTFILRKNDGERWLRYPHIAHEDVVMSYVTVARYGSVMSNKFVYADTKYGAEGGIGALEARMPNLIATASSMVEDFPGLVVRWKPEVWEGAIKIKFHSQKGINQWRKENEALTVVPPTSNELKLSRKKLRVLNPQIR